MDEIYGRGCNDDGRSDNSWYINMVSSRKNGGGGGGRGLGEEKDYAYTKRLKLDKFSASNFVNGIKTRSKENVVLSYNEREDLSTLLSMHVRTITKPAAFVSLMSSLSNLKQQTRSWDCSKDLLVISNALSFVNTASYTPQDTAIIFVSFAKMQAKYDRTLEENTEFLNAVANLMNKMNEKSVGDVLWGLGSMGAAWRDLPSNLQDALLKAVSFHATSFSSYTLPSVLWSLSKMGVRWSYLSCDVQSAFLKRLELQVSSMSPQQSSKVIWSLGTLGAEHHSFPCGMLSAHLENVNKIKKSQMGTAIPASQTLTGIAKTGIHWHKLSSSIKSIIWEQAERVVQSNNDRGTANAIWALGSIGSPYCEQPKPVREALFHGSSRVANTCSAWAFSNMLWGFAKMEYQWTDFPPTLKEVIKSNIGRLEPEMNAVDISVLTWSLGSLGVPLDSRDERSEGLGREGVDGRILGPLFDAISRNLPDMKSQEISSLIWGLSGTSISWDSLPQSLRWSVNVALRRVVETMSPQDLANCAYGLTLLSFDTENPLDPAFRGAHDTLLNKLQKVSRSSTASNVQLEQLRIFAHFYDTSKIGLSNDMIRGTRVPRDFLVGDLETQFSRELKGSNLQDRVVEGLQTSLNKMDFHDILITPEVSSFGGIFPVDALISLGGNEQMMSHAKATIKDKDVLAILEIDGPQHYREDGTLRRKDLLKECMYLKKHPKAVFCRVRWDEANKLGIKAIGESLASKIQELADRKKNPLADFDRMFGNIISNTQKEFAKIMRNDYTQEESKGDN